MKQYLDMLQHIKDNGVEKTDRTGTGTISVFGYQNRYNLQEGFPLVTTKKMFIKGMIYELLFFISGSTKLADLEESTQKWWSPWADLNGNLGPIYSHQMRNFGGTYDNIPQPIPKLDQVTALVTDDPSFYDNVNKEGLRYGILNIEGDQVEVQFENTGYIIKTRKDKLKSGGFKDHTSPSVKGVACLGVPSSEITEEMRSFLNIWRGMIARCYDPNKDTYKYYGGKGVHVSNRWLNFSNFYEDVRKIEGWDEEVPQELDKDILGNGFLYSLKTCKWVSKKENMEARGFREYTVEKEGVSYPFTNSSDFRREHGIKNQGNFNSMLRGARKKAEGFSLVEVKDTRKGVDQLKEVIHQIKTTPDSRRIVMSLWNSYDLPYQCLPCCHGSVIQFSVSEGKLSCHMYQRSADSFIGVPVNIASYALLTHMIAYHCDLEVGEFIHTFGDLHIYKNHVEQVDLQLTREPKPLPQLKLNYPKETPLEEVQFEDIEIVGYECHPAIKGEVSV